MVVIVMYIATFYSSLSTNCTSACEACKHHEDNTLCACVIHSVSYCFIILENRQILNGTVTDLFKGVITGDELLSQYSHGDITIDNALSINTPEKESSKMKRRIKMPKEGVKYYIRKRSSSKRDDSSFIESTKRKHSSGLIMCNTLVLFFCKQVYT